MTSRFFASLRMTVLYNSFNRLANTRAHFQGDSC